MYKLIMLTMLVVGASAYAEDERNLADLSLEELMQVKVSTGVRFRNQTQKDTTLSVIGFSSEDLRINHGGVNDLNMVLRDLVPSFNYLTEPLNDGSSHVRAFTLRGLPPDETLVLLNGKRYHRSALVQVGGSPQSLGSQGVDLSQIPTFGLKRVEVLRDGASSQYGSDAIAGVINLILDDRAEGTDIQVQEGRTAQGQSGETRVSVNTGRRLGENGFFNLTGEYVHKDEVSRGLQRPDAAYYASQGLSVADPAQIWGTPILYSSRFLLNARMDLASGTQAYLFGNFSDARSDSSFNYRALTRAFFQSNINTTDGSVVACPEVPGDTSGYQSARNCLEQANSNPSLFNFQSWFPGGFTPRLGVRNRDFSQTLGVNGEMGAGGTFDLSFSNALDRIDYELRHSINPSLGPNSPTTFSLGVLEQFERNLNADFVWPVIKQLSVAVGSEWREEVYQAKAGEPASWETGPYSALGIGANGMPGIDPKAAGRFERSNISTYFDTEYHASEALLISGATRFEKYSDFGNATNGKLSFRYLLIENLSLRGAAGTGFRAPSPGQANLTNISHNAGGNAKILIGGIIPPTDPIARFFGARPLEPERSENLSLGLAYHRKSLSLSVDSFQIKVKDRIELSVGMTLTDAIRAQMREAGITNSEDYDNISVFNNAADSVSKGVDVSAGYQMGSDAGLTEFKFDISYVNTHVTPNGSAFVPTEQMLHNLAHQTPETRAVLSVRHRVNEWKFDINNIFYGPFSVHNGTDTTSYPSKSVSNLETGYAPLNSKVWLFAAGVGNIFDTKAHDQDSLSIGSPYITENPFEYQGRTYYANAKYAF